MNIIEKFLTINPFSRPATKLQQVKKLVIHWVGNANSSAIANRNYFESLKDKQIYASAHYIIGLEGEIIECIPENEVAYHAGNYSVNCESIGIENCHPDWSGKFNSKTYNSLIELLVYLCKKYNLTQNDIIRHYDVTGKVCPKYYVEHEDAFEQLKLDVANKLGSSYEIKQANVVPVTQNTYDTYKVCYNGTNIRKVASLGSAIAYRKNAGDILNVVGSENGFLKLQDGNYIRVGFAYKTSTGANISSNGTQYRVKYNGTNIRIGASLNSSVAYLKNAGDIVTVIGTVGDFYRLSDGNYLRIGFAYSTGSSAVSSVTKYRVNADYVNIRSQASLNSSIVRMARVNEIINVIGSQNDFYRLDNGTYIRKQFASRIR